MKQFKDFRVFKKAVRKYWKRHAKQTYFHHNDKRMTSWFVGDNIWCYYLVTSFEELNHENIKEWFQYDVNSNMIDEFIENYKDLFGKRIIGTNIFKEELVRGEFIGFALVNNGVLFAIKSDDGTNLCGLNIKIEIDNQ